MVRPRVGVREFRFKIRYDNNEHKLWTAPGVGIIKRPPWQFIRLVLL